MATRKRTARREDERSHKKLLEARLKLAKLEPGGSAEQPLAVASASVVEPHAAAQPCVACGAQVRVQAHDAAEGLRQVHVQCTYCGQRRTVFYSVRTALPN